MPSMGSNLAITTTLKHIGHVADSIFTYLTVLVGYLPSSFEMSLGGRVYQLMAASIPPLPSLAMQGCCSWCPLVCY